MHNDRQRKTQMNDEKLARLRIRRDNLHRYRRLLRTQLTELERTYLERRLAEEQSEIDILSSGIFPRPLATSAPQGRAPTEAA
jgi:hypothetical protein